MDVPQLFFSAKILDIGNTTHQGLMDNSKGLYKERIVRYSVWKKKRKLMVDLFSITGPWQAE